MRARPITALVVALSFALAACGTDDGGSGGPTGGSGATTTPAVAGPATAPADLCDQVAALPELPAGSGEANRQERTSGDYGTPGVWCKWNGLTVAAYADPGADKFHQVLSGAEAVSGVGDEAYFVEGGSLEVRAKGLVFDLGYDTPLADAKSKLVALATAVIATIDV